MEKKIIGDPLLKSYPKCQYREQEYCPEPAGCEHQVGEFACAFKCDIRPAIFPRKLCYLMGNKVQDYDDSWEPILQKIFPNRFRRRCELLAERQPCRCPDLNYKNRRNVPQFVCSPRTYFESLETRLSPCKCPCDIPMYEYKEAELNFCDGVSSDIEKIKEPRELKLIVHPKQKSKTEKKLQKKREPKQIKLIKPKKKPKKKMRIPQQSKGKGIIHKRDAKNKNP